MYSPHVHTVCSLLRICSICNTFHLISETNKIPPTTTRVVFPDRLILKGKGIMFLKKNRNAQSNN